MPQLLTECTWNDMSGGPWGEIPTGLRDSCIELSFVTEAVQLIGKTLADGFLGAVFSVAGRAGQSAHGVGVVSASKGGTGRRIPQVQGGPGELTFILAAMTTFSDLPTSPTPRD